MAKQNRFLRLRNWVQFAFLWLWMSPLFVFTRICCPVFHCHSCPLAPFACPVGVLASFAAWHIFPFVAVGLLLAVAAAVGTLVCGWACPFGLFQDLVAKLPTPKFRIPSWLGHGRYVVLAVFVLAAPFWLGEGSVFFMCSLCPVGTLEAALPAAVRTGSVPSTARLVVLGVLVVAIVFSHRPWCRVLCPLGGLLALGNRWSIFRLRCDKTQCTLCGRCRRDCPYGADPARQANALGCVRCLECTGEKCGAIKATLLPGTPERCAPARPRSPQ